METLAARRNVEVRRYPSNPSISSSRMRPWKSRTRSVGRRLGLRGRPRRAHRLCRRRDGSRGLPARRPWFGAF